MARHESQSAASQVVDTKLATEIEACYRQLTKLVDLIQKERSPEKVAHLRNMMDAVVKDLAFLDTFGVGAQSHNH